MRQLAKLALVSGLGGCSLIYNPSNLPTVELVDAPPDAELILDADPTMLDVTAVAPAVILEGQGAAGSRRAVIAISGIHMVKDQTTVAITVHPGQAKTATINVDNALLDVAADGDMIAVPITIPQDDALLATDQIRLDVTVTQNTPSGPISKTLSALENDAPVLTLQGLPELRGANVTVSAVDSMTMFSLVDITGSIAAPAGTTTPIVLRSMTTLSVGAQSTFNAGGTTPGAAGGAGGTGGPGGLLNGSTGMAGGGPAGGAPSGGVGRFEGDDQLTSMSNKNRSSGGAGGNGVALGAAGGNGGGGGGSVELTAGGNLTIVGIDAKGADGTSATNPGGAGSGGIVLLRSGGSVTVSGGISVIGGQAPAPGADGRVRIDAPGTITAATTPAAHFRGPTFITATPMIVRSDKPMLTVIAQPQRNFTYFINNADGSESHGPGTVLVPPTGTVVFPLSVPLFRGINQLCAIVEGATAGTPEAGQCIQIVYLYSPE
jgi:hypothetical protein